MLCRWFVIAFTIGYLFGVLMVDGLLVLLIVLLCTVLFGVGCLVFEFWLVVVVICLFCGLYYGCFCLLSFGWVCLFCALGVVLVPCLVGLLLF